MTTSDNDQHSIRYNSDSINLRGVDTATIRNLRMTGARVHLKCLDDNVYMLIVENSEHYIYVKLTTRSKRGKMDAWIYEESPTEAPASPPSDVLSRSVLQGWVDYMLAETQRNPFGEDENYVLGKLKAWGDIGTKIAAVTAAPATTEPVCGCGKTELQGDHAIDVGSGAPYHPFQPAESGGAS